MQGNWGADAQEKTRGWGRHWDGSVGLFSFCHLRQRKLLDQKLVWCGVFPLLFHIQSIHCVGCYFSNSCDNVFFMFVENAPTLIITWSLLLVLAAWVRGKSHQWETEAWPLRVLHRDERGTMIKTIHSTITIIDNYLHKIMCLFGEFQVWIFF